MQQRTYASHVMPGLVAHYWRVVPVLEAILGQIPIVGSSYPQGFGHQECWHQGLANVPSFVATAVLQARQGPRTYLALEQRAVQWALHALGFVELFSWSPCASDSSRLAFARILLEPPKTDTPSAGRVQVAARIVRAEFMRRGLDAIVLFDGRRGMTLWIPFDDAPAYDPVRAWLHSIADALAASHPNLFTTKPNTDGSDLVHVHVDKNAPGSFSACKREPRPRHQRCLSGSCRREELECCRHCARGEHSRSASARFQSEVRVHGAHRIYRALQRERTPSADRAGCSARFSPKRAVR